MTYRLYLDEAPVSEGGELVHGGGRRLASGAGVVLVLDVELVAATQREGQGRVTRLNTKHTNNDRRYIQQARDVTPWSLTD